MSSVSRTVHSFGRTTSGVAAVETALVLPVLAALLIGVIEFSFVFYTYNTMQSAARDVARRVSINKLASGSVSGEVGQLLPKWAAPQAASTMSQSAPNDPETNLITISVALPSQYASPLTFFSHYGQWTLQTSVTMKQEAPL